MNRKDFFGTVAAAILAFVSTDKKAEAKKEPEKPKAEPPKEGRIVYHYATPMIENPFYGLQVRLTNPYWPYESAEDMANALKEIELKFDDAFYNIPGGIRWKEKRK